MYQWQLLNDRKVQNSSSTRSSAPALVRSSLLDVVPSGTVASRIRFLERHPSESSTLPRCPSQNRGRGESRLGFGRRLTNRFGIPASRNEHPDKELQVNEIHGYLGLNTQRTKHLQEHGMTDGGSDSRATYSCASGMDNQLQSQGFAERVQYDELSPWPGTPRNKSVATKMNKSNQKIEPLWGVDGFGNRSFLTTERAPDFPTLTAGIGHSDMHGRDVKTRHDTTMKSDISAITTSTVRRQSVRDLFADYGIERPSGLVSDEKELEIFGASKQIKSKVRCSHCSWYNPESSNWCFRCKYLLRTLKPKESYQSLVSPKGEQYWLEKASDKQQTSSPEFSAKENLLAKFSQVGYPSPQLGPEVSDIRKRSHRQSRKQSLTTMKFHSFNLSKTAPKSQASSPPETPLLELSVAPLLLKGIRTTSIVKESPFIIADRLLSGRSISSSPFAPCKDGSTSCHQTQSKLNLHQGMMPSDTKSESLACRATHEDHKPYRHSVICSSNKHRVSSERDNGYVAETSFAEDVGQNLSSQQYRAASQISKQAEIPQQDLGSEYIECHGYPRTGHARHGSATSAAGGLCQHCIDDCQCPACQKTHHSVRCCMNESHKGMAHHHHTSKAGTTAITLLDCPTFSLQPTGLFAKSPSSSTIRKSSAVVLPSLPNMNGFAASASTSQTQLELWPLSIEPKEKPRPLLKPTRSIFRERPESPKSPPWILDPKIRAKTPSTTAVSKLRVERAAADIALDVRAISNPPPLFKEQPEFAPLATWDKSDSECAPSQADTDSRVISNTFSHLFRFGETNAVPLLNQTLLRHQDELKKIEKECEDRIITLSEESGKFSEKIEASSGAKEKQTRHSDAKTSRLSSRASNLVKKRSKCGLGLVDKEPVQNNPKHAYGPEHTLSEDIIVNEQGEEICPPTWTDPRSTTNEAEKHDCVWRNRFQAQKSENRSPSQENSNTPLQGVTIVVHMEGKGDLVFEADLRKGHTAEPNSF